MEGYRYSLTIIFRDRSAFPRSETMEYYKRADLKKVVSDNITRETFHTLIITDHEKFEENWSGLSNHRTVTFHTCQPISGTVNFQTTSSLYSITKSQNCPMP